MITYTITPTRTRRLHSRVMFKGGAETVKFDYSPWAEDNGTVTGVTVTVEAGDASITNETLASDVKSMLVTTSNEGWSLIKLVATDGTNKDVQYLEVVSKDPERQVSDYGRCD